ncbi:sensor histidine kinase [Shewanella intestini]|uniref:histidine kinase n=1 Tax=Shewanella intestini TaxID=2017544 RepID=A0ABS5I6M1_9GAMM|nr:MULTISPECIES: sensor histidine kinase [Shewanella]MBR9728975.1 sensor histidine kinase [Shewanella intestini]MRG36959.1 GHKL domain-containing protein [Shewanella sp. XMDDZSB0408]
MRLIPKLQKRLLTRVLVTSFTIITLVGCALAWMLTLVFAQNMYNDTTNSLIAELPVIAAEFRDNNLVPITQAIDNDNLDTKYKMATCDAQFQTLWLSSAANAASLTDICEKYADIQDYFGSKYIKYSQAQSYFAYALSVEIESKTFHLVILKDASHLKLELDRFNRLTLFRLAIVLGVAYIFLTSAAYWSLLPLRRLRLDLQKIKDGHKTSLDDNYPIELGAITDSLNQLVSQSADRQIRYQNAMNDLAHSLKTRLAATIAIIDDKQLTQQQQHLHTMAQINDMDQMVKYQLKRAMLGRQGLASEKTQLAPLIDQIETMLGKIYQHKSVRFSALIPDELLIPLGKDDVMELMGNILENAYRLCISQIIVSVQEHSQYYEIIIEDDGPGIDDAIKQKIVQRGVRADTQSPGQGIGLAVCQEIIDTYNCTMQIETSELLGAKFIINIPIKNND